MIEVAVRDPSNRGGEILNRVAAGQTMTITRDGEPIAELRRLPRRPLPARLLLQRWHRLPDIDPARLRTDIDSVLDARP
jgi:antitoxin (DNA-binding transcriptional repressor) of toxin-antitoxin stability system